MYAIEGSAQSLQTYDALTRSPYAWTARSAVNHNRASSAFGWPKLEHGVLQGHDIDAAFAAYCNPLHSEQDMAEVHTWPAIQQARHAAESLVSAKQHPHVASIAISQQQQQQQHAQPFVHKLQHDKATGSFAAETPEHVAFGQSQHILNQPHGFRAVHDELEHLHRRENLATQYSPQQQDNPGCTSPIQQAGVLAFNHPQQMATDLSQQCPSKVFPEAEQVLPKPNCMGKESFNEAHSNLGALGADVTLVKRRIAKRDSARRMRAKRRDQLESLGAEIQELTMAKASLESSLKEVDSSLPGLKQQLDATLSNTHHARRNNEAMQLEIAMLQKMAGKIDRRIYAFMERPAPCYSSMCHA